MTKKNRLAAILLACCATICSLGATVQAGAVNLSDEATMTDEEKEIKKLCDTVINCTNAERAKEGLPELATLPVLNELACVRAEEISRTPTETYFSHTRPDGSSCFSLLKSNMEFKYAKVGENIAGGNDDPASTVEQWMNSPAHRENIMKDAYTHIGIGYYHDPNTEYEYYWTMYLVGFYSGTEPRVFPEQYIPGRSLGDVDGSCAVNSNDAKQILHYAASRAAGVEIKVVSGFEDAADVNSDGIIDARDASIILAYSAAAGANGKANLEDFIW
ncbi:MAG: hypothetical protein K2G88_01275 [Oscillospiraceae bacterium]|nr:hypothetical protein [Oscillospiraceae bacterium]